MRTLQMKRISVFLTVAAALFCALCFGGIRAKAAPPTVHDGTDYAAVYDYTYYVNRYADLKAAFANDEAAALKHFVTNGMKEGRQAIASFHVQSYAARYADLQSAFGKDLPAYYRHYVTYGVKEGRSGAGGTAVPAPAQTQPASETPSGTGQASEAGNKETATATGPVIVDSNTDTNRVPVIAPAADTKAVHNGVDYSEVFEAKYYADRYADLKAAFGYNTDQLLAHYLHYGYAEGRIAKAGVTKEKLESVFGSLSQARAVLDRVGWDLRKAFDYCLTIHHNREIVTPDLGTRAQANIGFTTGRGSCYVMAACFYEMAKELGYDAHQISGFVPRNDGTKSPHSWVEIDHADGVTRVYDISTYKNYNINTYAFTYGTKGTWRYIDYYRMN